MPAKLRPMMFCPDCNANLDNVPTGTACPSCGGTRRSAAVLAETVQSSAVVHEVSIITESNPADGTRRTDVNRPHGKFTSTSGRGEQEQIYEGPPPQNEENVPDALHRLRDTWNENEGAAFIWREHVGHEHVAVDGTLTTDGREIRCQVTRVEAQWIFRTRAQEGTATSHDDVDVLAASVVAAFTSKLKSADPNMILVLDANDAPAFADERVVEMARDAIRIGGYTHRWAEVWLVGPTTKLTTRLDDV